MRHQGIHESVMSYDDYAIQPLIQRFYADMEDNESDELSQDGQDTEDRKVFFHQFGDPSARTRLHTTTWLDLPEWIRMSESRVIGSGPDFFIAKPRVKASPQRGFRRETLTASQNRLGRGTSVKAMREVDTIDISRSPQRAGSTALAPKLAASIPLDINLGPLRRPWVYSPFAMARFTCRVEMPLETVIYPGQQSHGFCGGERELHASAFSTSCDSVGDMLDQILDMYGD
ncbi:hypothetical protein CcaCcLH18_07860 [Colletotrichum camelliae]|nr:hypothetical protein CcaCcLH18_07860 [Colletotrichum camelliae]